MMNLSIALKSANSRFFTDCYPISAAFTPNGDQIKAAVSLLQLVDSITKSIINHLKSVAWHFPTRSKTKGSSDAAGTPFVTGTVTILRGTGGAGTPGYPNDRRPVALEQQLPDGHERPVPVVPV